MADLSSLQLRQLWVTPGSPGSPLGCSKLLEAEGPLRQGDLPVLFSTLTSRGRAPARGCPGTGKFSPEGLFVGEVVPHVSSQQHRDFMQVSVRKVNGHLL